MKDSENSGINKVTQEIHDVLIRIWDPIGVRDCESAQDEYDSYIGKIYSLLSKGADQKEINAHLYFIETVTMGLSGKNLKREDAVRALLSIKI